MTWSDQRSHKNDTTHMRLNERKHILFQCQDTIL